MITATRRHAGGCLTYPFPHMSKLEHTRIFAMDAAITELARTLCFGGLACIATACALLAGSDDDE